MKVAIVGGTGSFGRALTERLHVLGRDVAIGSRDAARAQELAAVYGVEGGTNADVVRGADLVIISTRSNAAVDTSRDLADAIGDTPVLSVASDLRFEKGNVYPGRLGHALAEEIAQVVRAPVCAGLQTLAAAHLASGKPLDEDVFVCGDDPAAKDMMLELASRLVVGRAIDAGPLANARALEGMTAVLLTVNRAFGVQAGIRVTNLPA
ncbi:MAG TPA: NAD(P)-binding domain-containing protein [Gaiellaceae bacterium]|nr:NAD(P)-binding domain-containing protein [Gaiellaceae bacterium]